MIETLRIYSKGFLENVIIEELPPDPQSIRHEKYQFSSTSLRASFVMVRGIERRRIFESDRDREDFLDRLGRVIQEGGASKADYKR
jgi:hypothetical protein